MCKMYLLMYVCNKTEETRKLNGINFNVILKRNLTWPLIQRTSVITKIFYGTIEDPLLPRLSVQVDFQRG
jgi:hypothetical protein